MLDQQVVAVLAAELLLSTFPHRVELLVAAAVAVEMEIPQDLVAMVLAVVELIRNMPQVTEVGVAAAVAAVSMIQAV
jgi:hypothetical protein